MTHKKNKFFAILFSLLAMMPVANCGSKEKPPDAAYFHETGMKLFQDGFYELMPQGKMNDANRKFEQAEKAFEQAVKLDENAVESHRFLGRVYALRKNYSGAAGEFLRTIALEPENIDNYLILSSVYVRMKRYDDAEKVLAHAKTLSKEPAVIDQISSLIDGIRGRELKNED